MSDKKEEEIKRVINTIREFKGNLKWDISVILINKKEKLTMFPVGFDKYTNQNIESLPAGYDPKYLDDNYPILHKLIKEDLAKIIEQLSKLEIVESVRDLPFKIKRVQNDNDRNK
jgi:hypothetical protein